MGHGLDGRATEQGLRWPSWLAAIPRAFILKLECSMDVSVGAICSPVL